MGRKSLASQWGPDLWELSPGPLDTPCWLWKRSLSRTNGYPCQIKVEGNLIAAHRYAYVLAHGLIQEGMSVCHRCDVPRCVNPDHLFVGTHADNQADKAKKFRGAKKLTPEQIAQMYVMRESGRTYREIGESFGVVTGVVKSIFDQTVWKYAPRPAHEKIDLRRKLSDEDVGKVFMLDGLGWKQREIAKAMKVTLSAVNAILLGKRRFG